MSPEGLTPLLVELVVVAGQHVRGLPDTEPFNLSVPQLRLTRFAFRSQSRPSLTRVGWDDHERQTVKIKSASQLPRSADSTLAPGATRPERANGTRS